MPLPSFVNHALVAAVILVAPLSGHGLAQENAQTGATLRLANPAGEAGNAFDRELRKLMRNGVNINAGLHAKPGFFVAIVRTQQGFDDLKPGQRPVEFVGCGFCEDAFDAYTFGALGGRDEARRRTNQLLRERLEKVRREHRLTAAETAKLSLAGRGDIKRFLDGVEEKRKKFEQMSADIGQGMAFLVDETRPLTHQVFDGPFDEKSLFAKVLHKLLSDR